MGEEAGKPGQIADAIKQALPQKPGAAKAGAPANKQVDTTKLINEELKKMGVDVPNISLLDWQAGGKGVA